MKHPRYIVMVSYDPDDHHVALFSATDGNEVRRLIKVAHEETNPSLVAVLGWKHNGYFPVSHQFKDAL